MTKTLKFALGIGLTVSLLSGLQGCSDDGNTTPGTGGSAGSTAGTGGGGTAGTSSAGTGGTSTAGTGGTGTAGTGGTGGGPTGKTCGATQCAGETLAGILPANACCPDGDSADTCGLDLSGLSSFGITPSNPCQKRDQPGEIDDECDDTNLGGVVQVDGCCTPDGKCGYKSTVVASLGCVEPGALGITPEGGLQTCTPAAGGTGGAAGAAGTGGTSAAGTGGTNN